MSPTPQAFRPYMALAPVGVLYLASLVRMFSLQFHFAEEDGLSRVESEITLPAARGSILDRHGLVLAEDVTSWDLIIKYRLEHRSISAAVEQEKLTPKQAKERIAILADGTGIPFAEMWNALMVNPSPAQVLRRGLGPADRETVLRTLRMVKHSGLTLQQNFRRVYPNDRVLGHVIGLPAGKPILNEAGEWVKDEDASPGSGLELGLDSLLGGKDGVRRAIAVSGENGVNPALDMHAPVHGQSVRTTLDLELSTFAREELAELMQDHEPVHCFAIVVDVNNGQILSMLGLPDYDANDPANSMQTVVSPFDGKQGLAGWTYPGKWRIAPGSTIKPLMASYALERGAIQPDQWFDDFAGSFVPPHRLRRDAIHNSHGTPSGPMRAFEGIVHSSNIVFAQIGR
ncbi:MAG: penicillin-binding transpeptidase domain-containing protein, partial [Planctomycetota bacterium]